MVSPPWEPDPGCPWVSAWLCAAILVNVHLTVSQAWIIGWDKEREAVSQMITSGPPQSRAPCQACSLLQAVPQAQECLLTSQGTTVGQAMNTRYLETSGPKDVVVGGLPT